MRVEDGDSEDLLKPNPGTAGAARRTSWKSLFNFSSRQHAPILITGFLLSTAAGVTGPAVAIFFGKIFDAFSAYGSGATDGAAFTDKVSGYAIGLCIIGVAVWFLKGGYFGTWMVFGELQAKDARDQLFQNLLEKDLEWYELRTHGIGALLPRLQTQIRELQIGTSQPLGFSIQYVVQAVAALGLAFYTSWKLTLVILAGLPPAAIIMSFISSMMQPNIVSQEIKLSLASKLVNSALSAIDTVKCFNGQASELGQYKPVIMEAAVYYMKQALSNALQIGFVRFVTTAMFVQGFWYGSHLVTTGKTAAGDVLTTFWSCLMATKAIEDILPHMLVLEKGRAAASAMKAILNQMKSGSKVDHQRGPSAPKFCEGDIEVKDISFAYPSRPGSEVLAKSSFFFPAGETTFLVGKSGSGKSTLGNLLMRFYEPTTGTLLIDGTSIAELDVNWLRNNVTLVQQQTILFNESIFRNIAFGRRDHLSVTKAQVEVCTDLAALQSTIEAMPEGLDTQVGSSGSSLSGGQKQRVAVARARLRHTPILILDEATSALDYVSRKAVMKGILDWRRGKTTIVITHDLAQIRDDDFVYVLEDGRIVEDGYRRTLKSLQREKQSLAASGVSGTPTHFASRISAQQAASQQPERYSGVDFVTRKSIRRKDSVEMHLDSIPEPAIQLRPPSMVSDGPNPLSVAYERTSAVNLLRRFSGQSAAEPKPTSLYVATSSNAEKRQLASATPTAFNIHRVLSHGGRPMSMHQAMTMKSMYGEASISTYASSFCTSPTFHDKRPASTSLSSTSLQASKPTEPSANGFTSMRQILGTVWPTISTTKRAQLVLGFLCALVHAAGPPAFSFVFSELLATFFIKENQAQKAMVYSLAILGIAIIDALADGCTHYLLETCGRAWVDTLRLRAFERILDQQKAWFEDPENDAAVLTTILDRNAEEMRNLVGRFAPFIVIVAVMMSIATIWSLVVCWKVTLVGIAAAPSLYVVTKGFEATSSKMERLTNDAGSEASSIFIETFSDIRTVRALTLESYFHKKFNKATSAALMVGIKRAIYCGFFFGASDSIINFVTALVFWYGARVAREGSFSVKSILTVFAMLLFSTANANAVIAYIPQISASADTASRLLRLSNLSLHKSHEHTGPVRLNPSSPSTLSGPLQFTNFTFSYPSRGPSAPALRRLNLTIPAGTSTALVGSSGSGKSTVASLLLGLYPAPPGSPPFALTLSGHPISSLYIPTVRACVSVVAQTPTLFPTTVRANISYGLPLNSPLTTTANIHAAADRAGIHDFILSLPDGYETVIGDGGLGVSGGQAQRLAIARALARRPKILILDEATSALDAAAVQLVGKTIVDLVNNPASDGPAMTVLIITHAREMMASADNVVVLDQGRVVEQGSYAELVARRGGALWTMLRSDGVGTVGDEGEEGGEVLLGE